MRTKKMFLFLVWINPFVLIGDSLLLESDPDSLNVWAKLKADTIQALLSALCEWTVIERVPLPNQPRTLDPVVLGVTLPLQLQRRLHGGRSVHLDLP